MWESTRWPCKCNRGDPFYHHGHYIIDGKRKPCNRCLVCEEYEPDIPEAACVELMLGPDPAFAPRLALAPMKPTLDETLEKILRLEEDLHRPATTTEVLREIRGTISDMQENLVELSRSIEALESRFEKIEDIE